MILWAISINIIIHISTLQNWCHFSVGGSAGWGLHITLTKCTLEESVLSTKQFHQLQCQSCDAKTIMACYECQHDLDIGAIGAVFCNPLSGQMCYCNHMDKWH
jgi:hypothetical protein